MSQSLASECTPLKHRYDDCFNNWFAGYLQPQESSKDSKGSTEGDQSRLPDKVKDYHEKCGKLWDEYKDCLLKAVQERGLNEVLERAREEAPLKDIKSMDEDS